MKEHNLPPRKDIPSYWRDAKPGKTYLHLGEFPFEPTHHVLQAIQQAAQSANRYPDTNALRLREKLASYVGHGMKPENIIVGNGSDDMIDLCILSFTHPDEVVVTFEPSFFVYRFSAQRHHITVVPIQREEDFDLPQTLEHRLQQLPITVTFIANPNNPTGTLATRERLRSIVEQLPGIIIVDECYFEYCNETVADWIAENSQLIVLRSLSKSFGLSGLRLGYAIAHESLIQRLEAFALTFPVNALAQAAGIAALEDVATYRERIASILQSREQLRQALQGLGLEVLPSATNFLLTLWPAEAAELYPARKLAEQGIFVSDQSAAIGLDRPALRIAVGTPQENERGLESIRKILS